MGGWFQLSVEVSVSMSWEMIERSGRTGDVNSVLPQRWLLAEAVISHWQWTGFSRSWITLAHDTEDKDRHTQTNENGFHSKALIEGPDSQTRIRPHHPPHSAFSAEPQNVINSRVWEFSLKGIFVIPLAWLDMDLMHCIQLVSTSCIWFLASEPWLHTHTAVSVM